VEPSQQDKVVISVVVLNYNGARWLERCISSVLEQSFRSIELIVADNLSTDGSDQIARQLLAGIPNARFISHGQNLGYCEGNNRAVAESRGEFIFLLNNDAWLEKDCLEKLFSEVRRTGASAATPMVLNWDEDTIQRGTFASGFDLFGFPSFNPAPIITTEILMPAGCSYFIRRDLFLQLGGLDPVIFMYADEWDLSWKLWAAGHSAVVVPSARLHHRGAANVNPAGGDKVVELRTSETKRFYANRNALLVLLKNCENLLLILVLFQTMLLLMEMVVALILVRRWSFIKNSYLNAFRDLIKLAPHIRAERLKLNILRKRGDFFMLRFFRLRMNRWDELMHMTKVGAPKVSPR
jgi:GT2 family glycosyltransferase